MATRHHIYIYINMYVDICLTLRFENFGVLFVDVLVEEPFYLGSMIGPPHIWKLPF